MTTVIEIVSEQEFDSWVAQQDTLVRNWLKQNQFKAAPGSICTVPNPSGELQSVLFGEPPASDFWQYGALPGKLPPGEYRFHSQSSVQPQDSFLMALGWHLGCYQYNKYREDTPVSAELVLDPSIDADLLMNWVKSLYLVRDLINTPTDDMGPEQLSNVARDMAKTHKAKFKEIVGDDLLKQNYPAIHAVGRASVNPPRLLDIRWGDKNHPTVTLVGKGVCFDSGGLNLKGTPHMLTMKKDMAGAAHALGLARMIMARNLPVRLRVLIPTVENLVSGNSYHPGDVVTTRSGLTVEITNTDAEGRVILSDALTEAASEKPNYLFDFATLTGAAAVALGLRIASLFSNDDAMADGVVNAAQRVQDLVWRMPLHSPYRELYKAKIANIKNSAGTPYAGSITAALFLQDFVDDDVSWMHFDMGAWNPADSPGRPEGGEAMAIRGVFEYLSDSLS